MVREEEEDEEETGFYFRNQLGLETRMTLENFDRVKSKVILREEHIETAEVKLPEYSEESEDKNYFRSVKEFISLIRYVRL